MLLNQTLDLTEGQEQILLTQKELGGFLEEMKTIFLSVINETRQIMLERLDKTVEFIQTTHNNLAERGITVTLYGEDIKVM